MSSPSSNERSSSDRHTPSAIEQHDARTLAIRWADGQRSLIDVRALRLACACAHCVDEWSGQALLAPDSVPQDVAPIDLQSVGRYAVQIRWSDGHDTGIYPFERIRRLADERVLTAPVTPTAAGTVDLPLAGADEAAAPLANRKSDDQE
jgi:ATP-binding protein involved in chromosome partitioning